MCLPLDHHLGRGGENIAIRLGLPHLSPVRVASKGDTPDQIGTISSLTSLPFFPFLTSSVSLSRRVGGPSCWDPLKVKPTEVKDTSCLVVGMDVPHGGSEGTSWDIAADSGIC